MDILNIQQSLDRIVNKRILSLDEACDLTGISRSFMYKLTAARKIPYCKPNWKKMPYSSPWGDNGFINEHCI